MREFLSLNRSNVIIKGSIGCSKFFSIKKLLLKCSWTCVDHVHAKGQGEYLQVLLILQVDALRILSYLSHASLIPEWAAPSARSNSYTHVCVCAMRADC
jgi:hypothetical protein